MHTPQLLSANPGTVKLSADLQEVGVFHSHIRHPANFSSVDFDLHVERFPNLWHLIVSLRNPDLPQVRGFGVSERSMRELTLDDGTTPAAAASSPDRALRRATHVPAAWRSVQHGQRTAVRALFHGRIPTP